MLFSQSVEVPVNDKVEFEVNAQVEVDGEIYSKICERVLAEKDRTRKARCLQLACSNANNHLATGTRYIKQIDALAYNYTVRVSFI